MEAQKVEYDSVADLRVPVSDSEEEDYEVADERGEYSLPTAVRSTVVGPGPTHVGPSDEYVDAAASGRVVTSVRASDSISATGTSSSESRGFLSSISRRILPSWFGSDSDRQPDRAVGGPMETSTQFVASSQQLS